MLTDGTYSVGTTAGALHVSDIMFDVVSGQYNGGFGLTMNATKIIGYRAVVDASGEDIGTITAKTFPYSVLNDSTLYVYSTSTQDYSGGTGAHQIIIKGIDSTGGSSTSIISANGTYHANALTYFSKVLSVTVTQAGSLGSNDGTIYVKTLTGDTEIMNILPGQSNSYSAVYCTINGQTAYIKTLHYQCSASVTLYVKIKVSGGSAWNTFDVIGNATGNNSKDINLYLNSGDDLRIFGQTASGSASVYVTMDVINIVSGF